MWASAILPQPTRAILSTADLLAAIIEETLQTFRHGNGGFPAEQIFQFVVRIFGALPIRMPASAIISGRQLPLGIVRVFFPQVAKQITAERRQIEGTKTL